MFLPEIDEKIKNRNVQLSPADAQCQINVGATSLQRHDVDFTLRARYKFMKFFKKENCLLKPNQSNLSELLVDI